MKNINETGHAKNVANFEDMIAFAAGYGATYNPAKAALQLPQLNELYVSGTAALKTVVDKNTEFNNAVNTRVDIFDELRTLATRIVNALESGDAPAEKVKDAKGFQRKIQGRKASSPKVKPQDPNEPAPASISASQQSYDQLIQHFAALIATVASEPTYAPNEIELSVKGLNAKLEKMKLSNTDVSTGYAAVSNARLARNKTLYKENTGLVDIALAVKKYVQSVFGATSAEYAQVSIISFRNRKD